MNEKLNVQYGCGLTAPKEWRNFDVSPTLKFQRVPLFGLVFKKTMKTVFPNNVSYGNIIKGLPLPDNCADLLYCSHTLEHLALNDFRKALQNSYAVLKPNGIFRCIVPDLEWSVNRYIDDKKKGEQEASIRFINSLLMGVTDRPKGVKGLLKSFLGNSRHLWMWDHDSLKKELENTGFRNIRVCSFNDAEDDMFKLVEEEGRFQNAVALECIK